MVGATGPHSGLLFDILNPFKKGYQQIFLGSIWKCDVMVHDT